MLSNYNIGARIKAANARMDIRFQRMVDRWVGIPACAALSLWHRGVRSIFRNSETLPPKSILVILLSEMGSLVLADPMFRRLQDRYPKAEIHMMLFARNRQMLDLLGVVKKENVITIRDDSLMHLLCDLAKSFWRMRTIKFDAVLDCELFSRISAILSGLSGAPRRAGFHRHTQEGLYRGSFINSPVAYNPYRHLSHQLVTLADSLQSHTMPRAKDGSLVEKFAPPTFHPAPGEVESEIAKLHHDHPALAGKKLVMLYPSGGLLPIRAWPLQHFVQVAQQLLQDGCAIGVIGMPEDRPLAEQLRAACGGNSNCVNLAGYTRSVRHLICLFHRTNLLITNDGGPGQFAAMTPMPNIVFFGPETPTLYASWSPHSHAFYTNLPCSPCLTAYNHRNSPCDGDNQCLKRILPAEVLAKAREMIASSHPIGVNVNA